MKTKLFAVALLSAAAFAACPAIAAQPTMVSNDMVTGSNGMTLYVFDKDVADSGKSACNGPCAGNWPPLLAADDAKDSDAGSNYKLIVRDDGKKQWTLKGKPLYFWKNDQKPGDKTGDGFNNVWHVAKP